MKSYLFSLFAISLLIIGSSSCSRLETVDMVDEEYGERVTYTRNKKDFAKQGTLTRYSKAGNKLEEATYQNDTLHGKRTLFYGNGQPESIENYVKGQFEGDFLMYYENQKDALKQKGQYVNGVMEGQWEGYYSNGQLKEVVTFKDNNENGPFTEYYENGKLKAEGSYLNGDHEHGLLKMYDEQGLLNKKMECENGRCKTIWTKETDSQN